MFVSSAFSSAVASGISIEKLSPALKLLGKSTSESKISGESQSKKTATPLKQSSVPAPPGFSIVTYLPGSSHTTSFPSVMSSKSALQGGLTKGLAESPTLTWYPVLQGSAPEVLPYFPKTRRSLMGIPFSPRSSYQ